MISTNVTSSENVGSGDVTSEYLAGRYHPKKHNPIVSLSLSTKMAGVVNVYTDTRLPIYSPALLQKKGILIESLQRLLENPCCNKDVLRARLAEHVEKRRFMEEKCQK